MRILTLAMLTAALPLAACHGHGFSGDTTPGIKGSGSGDTRSYQVADFTGVDLRGSDDVEVKTGAGFAVRAEGPSAELDRLKITRSGDTLRIAPGAYRVGLNAPGADGCRSDWPWDCMMAPLPSGPDAARPTRLLGQAEDGSCREPPQLWGTERVTAVLNLTGTRHAEAACLEITDHSSCAEFHSGALKCERDSFPYGDWARAGVLASDSADVRLAQLDIHGLANAGVQAGRLRDWRLQEVRIAGNGWVGWNGDLGGDKGSSNSGLMHFSQVEIEWNGCPEAFSTAVGAPASLPAR
eukprot:gene40297-54493_t